ncbi:MAG: SOS response-associated peptidase [Prolixibacteraceae bacterium]|nr:SOS response-associated peptidase [Prolixibacteraceae bacterium]NLO01667.1 SOS response-associated peptidase [Bacteroidales bacterium]
MCGRFVQVIDIELFIKRFGVREPVQITLRDNYNISAGDMAYVITNDNPGELQEFRFGLTPHWAKKQMYLINARSEGDNNPDDDPSYSGTMGIINKPSFRTPIRSKRCLVIANGYFEGPRKERLNKPYFISKKNLELFTFAGIWDTWIDNETSEVVNSFSIITTVSNPLTLQIGHHRSPVILDRNDEARWINDNLPLEEALGLLKPYKGNEFNAVAVSVRIKDPKNKGRDLIIPVETGNSLEFDSVIKKDLRLEGMGRNKRK